MTEITDDIELNRPNPWALGLAMVAGPVLVTAATFWLIIPVYALMLGGPFYLIVGFPVAWWHLHDPAASPASLAGIAFLTNFAACVLGLIVLCALDMDDLAHLIPFYMVFGTVFAPLWGVATGYVYRIFVPSNF